VINDLAGKVAVVTGGASGIGLALVEAFVEAGARVVVADIEEPVLAREIARLDAAGADVLGVVCDVRELDHVEALAARTIENFGAVHVVCNNAGVAPVGPMIESNATEWRWVLDVNVLGVANCIMVFGPTLVAQGEGHIVNTASGAGLATTAFLGLYHASKHAVVGLSEALYKELADTGVGVSVLCPELVDTPIFESERNAPDGVDQNTEVLSPLREVIAAVGIPAAQVAADVLDAVRSDRFWILTHPETVAHARARIDDLEAGRNPTDAYAASRGSEPTEA